MTRGAVRLAGALVVLSGAVMLTGCSGDAGAAAGDFSGGCYAPLACGPSYPVAYYPWAASPYVGYLHDPAHTVIVSTGGRTSVTYQPYAPPLRPAFQPPAPRQGSAGTGARPAPPKPAQAKPAAPAARTSTRK